MHCEIVSLLNFIHHSPSQILVLSRPQHSQGYISNLAQKKLLKFMTLMFFFCFLKAKTRQQLQNTLIILPFEFYSLERFLIYEYTYNSLIAFLLITLYI